MKMITLREIADDKSSISSTRWGWASIIKFDIFTIFIVVAAGITAHFLEKDFDSSFYTSVAMLLGILTGFIATTKALQGWEPHKNKPTQAEIEQYKNDAAQVSKNIESAEEEKGN